MSIHRHENWGAFMVLARAENSRAAMFGVAYPEWAVLAEDVNFHARHLWVHQQVGESRPQHEHDHRDKNWRRLMELARANPTAAWAMLLNGVHDSHPCVSV